MNAEVRELTKGTSPSVGGDVPETTPQEKPKEKWTDRPIQELVADHPRLLLALLVVMAIPYFLMCLGVSLAFLTGGTCG